MEARYPAMIPMRMGRSLIIPLPSSVAKMVASRVIMEIVMAVPNGTSSILPSPVCPVAIWTATGARISPMVMMTGPVTMGGSRRWIKPLPLRRINRLRTT